MTTKIGVHFFREVIKFGELHPIDKQKINLIQNFPIPNTKEDILEFIILASPYQSSAKCYSGIEKIIYNKDYQTQNSVNSAWKTKFEQACQKAVLSFKDDYEFLEQLENITGKALISKQDKNKIRKEKFKKFWGI